MSDPTNHHRASVYPKGFLWGAATASHQVEGGTTNDWSMWEKANAERLAREAESKFGYLPNWKDIAEEATNPANYISGESGDHYHRFKEDFRLAHELGHSATRFSIEWSRIERAEGQFDQKEIEHYREVLKACRSEGLEPFVTLWHWTLPVWLAEKGGIASKQFPYFFERYARKMAEEFQEDVTFWITLNEPDVVASHAYFKGVWPPQQKSLLAYYGVLRNLLRAHKRAYVSIKSVQSGAQVGIAKHQVAFEVKSVTWLNTILYTVAHYLWNRWFLNALTNHQDFIGLNFYNRNVIDGGFSKNENKRRTDFGWEFYPSALYQALVELKVYGKPIYITENGIADAKDIQREEFIKVALTAVERALREGVDVRGYLYWSLLDNFEWDKGFWPRFGLIEVHYKTKERTIRPSAYAYKKIIEQSKA